MELENLMYEPNRKERVYTIGDLESLSASVLYGFDPSRPLGGINVPLFHSKGLNLPDFSKQFNLLNNYGSGETYLEKIEREIKEREERFEKYEAEQKKREEKTKEIIMNLMLPKKSEPLSIGETSEFRLATEFNKGPGILRESFNFLERYRAGEHEDYGKDHVNLEYLSPITGKPLINIHINMKDEDEA